MLSIIIQELFFLLLNNDIGRYFSIAVNAAGRARRLERMTPLQLVLRQWVCISLYVVVCFVSCVCMKFSEFQNFNKRVKFFPLIILCFSLGSTFNCCKILFITISPENS